MAIVSNELSTWLARELNERSWSAREFARRIGLSGTSVSRYLEGSLTPSPKTCRKIAAALGLSDPNEIMRLAGHLPVVPKATAEEEEILSIVRDLPEDTRSIVVQMLRGLQADARYKIALAESSPQYETTTLNDQIAALIKRYPRLIDLFDEAQELLPDAAIYVLIANIRIWVEMERRKVQRDFARLHRLLTDFFTSSNK